MPNITSTNERVATKSTVLVVAVGLVALAAAAAFALLPRLIQNESTTTTARPGAKALKVADVTRAFADVDQYGPFYGLVYRAGSKTVYTQTTRVGDTEQPVDQSGAAVLTIARADAVTPSTKAKIWKDVLLLPKAAGAATPFSIADIPFAGLPTQMILLQYRQANDQTDRYLTICIGQTSAAKVYVATDGSTYTNSNLTSRTTSQPCGAITNRAFTPTKITGGSLIAEPSSLPSQTWRFIRFFIPLADFNRSGYVTPDDPSIRVTLPSQTPLWGGFLFADASTEQTSPAAMFRIESETAAGATTTTLCFPRLTLDPTTGGPIYYFDNQGTPYHDIMLKTRAMATTCPGLVAKSLAPESVTRASTSPTLPGSEESGYYTIWVTNRGKTIGVTNGTIWQTIDNGPSRNIVHPLALGLGGGIDGDQPVTIPSVNVSITDGTNRVSKLCFAGASNVTKSTVVSWQLLYYYDTALRPYRDLFLTDPVICTPTSPGGGGPGPIKIPTEDAPAL